MAFGGAAVVDGVPGSGEDEDAASGHREPTWIIAVETCGKDQLQLIKYT